MISNYKAHTRELTEQFFKAADIPYLLYIKIENGQLEYCMLYADPFMETRFDLKEVDGVWLNHGDPILYDMLIILELKGIDDTVMNFDCWIKASTESEFRVSIERAIDSAFVEYFRKPIRRKTRLNLNR